MNTEVLIFTAIEVLFCSIDIMLLHYYFSTFLEKRTLRLSYILIMYFASILFLYFATSKVYYSNLSTIFSIVIMLVYGFSVFKGKSVRIITVTLFYYILSGLFTLLISSVITLFTPFYMEQLFSNLPLRICVTLLIKLVVFVTGFFLQKRYKEQTLKLLNAKSLIMFFCIVLIILLLLFEFLFLNSSTTTHYLVTVMAFVFVICIGIISFLIYRYFETKEVNTTMEVRLNEAMIKNQSYIQQTQQQLELLKIRHDLKNHLITLSSFIEQDRKGEAQEYIKAIFLHPGLKTYVNTNNEIINAILNQKITEYPNIHFKVRHDDGQYILASDKLTIILGNILDNAIEAVEMLEDKSSEIKIVLSENHSYIKFYISNHFRIMPEVVQGKFISRKQSVYAGLGMLNIEEAVKSLGGDIKFSFKENLFESVVLIEKQQVDQ